MMRRTPVRNRTEGGRLAAGHGTSRRHAGWGGLLADIRRSGTPRGRARLGRYSIEGLRLHERALRAGVTVEAALISEEAVREGDSRTRTLVADLESSGCRCEVAPDEGGRMPSSDVPMHHLIYCARPDVNAVFHGHDAVVPRAAEAMGVPTTPSLTTFGTLEDAHATVRALGQHDYIVRKDHGFVAVDKHTKSDAAGTMRTIVDRQRCVKGLVLPIE